MIIFDLICEHEHRFEGWFRDASTFDTQLAAQMVSCPQCESLAVRKVPSAVAIGTKSSKLRELPVTASAPAAGPVTAGQVLSLYKQLTAALTAMTEDVGSDFADEARKMHYCETPERAIRGQTTEEEYEALCEEGITVLRLPFIREDDLN